MIKRFLYYTSYVFVYVLSFIVTVCLLGFLVVDIFSFRFRNKWVGRTIALPVMVIHNVILAIIWVVFSRHFTDSLPLDNTFTLFIYVITPYICSFGIILLCSLIVKMYFCSCFVVIPLLPICITLTEWLLGIKGAYARFHKSANIPSHTLAFQIHFSSKAKKRPKKLLYDLRSILNKLDKDRYPLPFIFYGFTAFDFTRIFNNKERTRIKLYKQIVKIPKERSREFSRNGFTERPWNLYLVYVPKLNYFRTKKELRSNVISPPNH